MTTATLIRSASPGVSRVPAPTPLPERELAELHSRHKGAMTVVRDLDQRGRAMVLLAVLTGDPYWLEHVE